MTEPAITTPEPRRAGQAEQDPASTKQAPGRTGDVGPTTTAAGGWLAFTALTWLLIALLAGRRSLTGGSQDFDLVLAAAMLPALVQASMVAGAAVGLWCATGLTRRGWNGASGLKRGAIGTGAGLFAGALAGTAVMIAYQIPSAAAMVMAAAIAVAAGLGGALGTVPPARLASPATAGITSALAVIVVSYGVNLVVGRSRLLAVFGADGTPEGDYTANGLLAGTLALATGILAGLVAYWLIRRSVRRTGTVMAWPGYAVAGAGAGLMLIMSELFIRLGGPMLLAMADSDVSADQVAQTMAAQSRLNTGIVVLFVGAVCAIIAVGRTLGRKPH